jgi:hypothetical protein
MSWCVVEDVNRRWGELTALSVGVGWADLGIHPLEERTGNVGIDTIGT